jgi:hypothetical protein
VSGRWALVAALLAGCGVFDRGLPAAVVDGAVADAPRPGPQEDAALPDLRPDRSPRPDGVAAFEPAGVAGAPGDVGCADGTREGFASAADWPRIAGCAGAWQVPGAQSVELRCDRQGGDTGPRPDGQGCSAADLCALGWHVCRDGAEVDHASASGCEGAVQAGETRLFIVAAGASPQGVCAPDPLAANDLHGCGGEVGLPEGSGCAPLERRMGFAECAATGVWACGTADDHLREATLVTKHASRLGGVLCCRD